MTFSLEIVPQEAVVHDPKFGEVTVRHAQSIVYYLSPSVETRSGKIEIAFLPDVADVLHKMPHTDQLGRDRLEEVMSEARRITGRELEWGEHYAPVQLVAADAEIPDVEEAGQIDEIDEAEY